MKERFDWDWAGAESEYKRALELNPNYASAHQRYGTFLAMMGRTDEGIRELAKAQQLDPLSLIINSDLGFAFYVARQYDRAIEQELKTIEMDPTFRPSHTTLAACYERKRMYAEAIQQAEKAADVTGGSPGARSHLASIYARAGRKEEARKIAGELKARATREYMPPYYIALIYEGLGEMDEAFTWFEKAYAERSPSILRLRADPRSDDLRSDPRFIDLMKRAGLPI